MRGTGKTINELYFGYSPAAYHIQGCPRHGTDTWDVTRFTRFGTHDEVAETVIRLACDKCGLVAFTSFDGERTTETTHADVIGFGRKPEKVAGLWLHAGPPFWYGDDRPERYYVTTTKDRPQRPEDAAGLVAWSAGPRGGVRWQAGLGLTERGAGRQGAGRDFPSRRAAVEWIASAIDTGQDGAP
jgi:hypothetical protein